jgi:hypothetical protein
MIMAHIVTSKNMHTGETGATFTTTLEGTADAAVQRVAETITGNFLHDWVVTGVRKANPDEIRTRRAKENP